MSFPVFFLYASKAEVKMESRLEREVLAVGTVDIMARKDGDEGLVGWWEYGGKGAGFGLWRPSISTVLVVRQLPYMDSFVPMRIASFRALPPPALTARRH
jgi:hypothetical protein